MPPFVVAMEEGRYGLWRLRADDDEEEEKEEGVPVGNLFRQ